MKSTYKTLLLVIAAFGLFSFSQPPYYRIHGKINVDGETVYLKGFHNKMFYNIDSTKIVNGEFVFTGSVQHPDLYGLSLKRDDANPYYIFVENSRIQVEIDTNNKNSANITGSAANDFFVQYHNKKGLKIDSLIKTNPASSVVAYLLYREFATDMSGSEIEAHLALFDPSLNDLSYIKELKAAAIVKKNVDVGNPAPDFTGMTPEGKNVKLSDHFGNYLLLDFWASWCGPCRKENPNVLKAYNKYKSQGFSVFGVSLDRNKEAWMNALAKDSLTWVNVSDLKFWDSAPAKLYNISKIPSNVLIDPSGKIAARNLRGEDLVKKLVEIYGK
ncbi:MAG: TlpA disulfide reductase family protein [Bacteroidales bacterium]|nr:AhpC/TSA family protein [Bacteroidales bacterium]